MLLLGFGLTSVGGCGSEEASEPPPSREQDEDLQRAPVDPRRSAESRSETERDEQDTEVFDLDRESDTPGGGGESTDPNAPLGDPLEPGERGIELEVVDATTGELIPIFQFARSEPDGRLLEALIDVDRIGFIELDDGETAHIVIEAQGYEPTPAIELELAAGESGRRLRVEMQQAALASGVELTVWNPDTSPVTKVEVKLERRDLGAAFDTPFQAVWERGAEHAEGRYRFPDLRPGHYKARVRGVDENGDPLLLVAHEFEFDFEGVSLFQETIVLTAGGQIELTVLDPVSQQPIARNDVNVWLLDAAGEELDVLWAAREGERLYVADGSLPRPRACRLESPLRPGSYTVRVRRLADQSDQFSEVQELEVPLSVIGGSVTQHIVR